VADGRAGAASKHRGSVARKHIKAAAISVAARNKRGDVIASRKWTSAAKAANNQR